MRPRYYQTNANNAAWHYLANESGNPLIVLPTGAGKSLVIAMLCKQTIEFAGRVVVLQHRKELIEQNADKIRILLPGISVGLYSAGLNSRHTRQDVLCAGIQSVFKKCESLGRRELIVIDEAHLVSGRDESMYGQFLRDVREKNPQSRVVGLTATPYRTSEGPLCGKSKLFQRICYEIQTGKLINEGYLCRITNKPADAQVDTAKIAIRGGDFVAGELERAFDVPDNVKAACNEIVSKCGSRHSVLCFAAGVNHAEHVAQCLESLTGEKVGIVTGQSMPLERQASLSDFRKQRLRWLVNCEVLTTGFDSPCIDAIAVLRSTMSPGLFAQICGRGLRQHESKSDCLILDFGGNIQRHGSLDDPEYGRQSYAAGRALAVVANNGRGKLCWNCGLDIPARATVCDECGSAQPVSHDGTADTDGALTGELVEDWIVKNVTWNRHQKKGDPDAPHTLRINYECAPMLTGDIEHECKYSCGSSAGVTRRNGPHIELICKSCGRHQKFVPKTDIEKGGNLSSKLISEWVCLEHEGFALRKAVDWWQARSSSEVPLTIAEGMQLLDAGACRHPSALRTKKEGKYYRVINVEFSVERPESCSEQEQAERVEQRVFSGVDDDVPF